LWLFHSNFSGKLNDWNKPDQALALNDIIDERPPQLNKGCNSRFHGRGEFLAPSSDWFQKHECFQKSVLTIANSSATSAFFFFSSRWSFASVFSQETRIYKRRQRWHHWWTKLDQRSESRLDFFGVPRCIWNRTVAINQSTVDDGERHNHATRLRRDYAWWRFKSILPKSRTIYQRTAIVV